LNSRRGPSDAGLRRKNFIICTCSMVRRRDVLARQLVFHQRPAAV
jgi:hypothetical protein